MKRGLRKQTNPVDDYCNIKTGFISDLRFILSKVKEFIKGLITFIKQIPGYYKLYTWYEYDPMTYDFIVFHYQKVLCNRTKRMSKPTYNWEDVTMELDMYYESIYQEEIERLEESIRRLEKEKQWILVKDQLPTIYEESKASDTVLVQGYDKETNFFWQAMGWYSDESKQWYFAECKNTDKQIDWINIIAWQPLPKDLKMWKNNKNT